MPSHPRNPDYLRVHGNLGYRLRNLETGVHPTGGELSYYDTYEPTVVQVDNASHWKQSTESSSMWKWQRRVGQVSMMGYIQNKNGVTYADFPDEEVVGTLPREAWPIFEVVQFVPMMSDPFQARIKVAVNGEVTLYKFPNSVMRPDGPWQVRFEGPTWTVN